MKKKIIATVIILITTIFTFAQTTWTGNSNSSWNKSTNWTNGVPTQTIDAIIDSTENQPEITSDAECKNLSINQGAYLKIGLNPGNSSHLEIFGDLDICTDSGLILKEKNFLTVHGTTCYKPII